MTDAERLEQEEALIDELQDEDSGGVGEKLDEAKLMRLFKAIPALENIVSYAETGQLYIKEDFDLGDYHFSQGEYKDSYDTFILAYLQDNRFKKMNRNNVMFALRAVAYTRRFYKFDRHMKRVKELGKVRPNMFKEITDVWLNVGSEFTSYTEFWLKSLMLSIYKNQSYRGEPSYFERDPTRYYVIGKQGIGKSMMIDGICFGDSFDLGKDFENQDTEKKFATMLVANLDDKILNKMSDTDAMKSLVTRNTAVIVPKYSNNQMTLIRRAVVVGSTNRVGVYNDTTGDRREFPIVVGKGLTNQEAEQCGREWFNTIREYNKSTNPGQYWLDLWATFFDQVNVDTFDGDPKSNTKIDKLRHSYIDSYSTSSDLDVAVSEMLGTEVQPSFDNEVWGEQITSIKMAINSTTKAPNAVMKLSNSKHLISKSIKNLLKENYGIKFTNNQLKEVMKSHGLVEKKRNNVLFYRKGE